MSPRLPSTLWSARRMTFISGLHVCGGVGIELETVVDDVLSGFVGGRRSIAARATLAVARRAPGASVGDALGVRQQRHLTRVLDRVGDVALLLHGVARDPPVADLGPVAHEAAQKVDVFVVDVVDLVGDEHARLLLELLRVGVFRRTRLVLLAGHLVSILCVWTAGSIKTGSETGSDRSGSERLFVAVDRIGGAIAAALEVAAAGVATLVAATGVAALVTAAGVAALATCAVAALGALDLGGGPAQTGADLVGDDLDD